MPHYKCTTKKHAITKGGTTVTSKPRNLFTFIFGITLILTFGSGTALAEFDRNDPDDLLLLNFEIFFDPIGIGYFQLRNRNLNRALMNEPENNVGGEVGPLELTPTVVLEAMSFNDYRRATPAGRAYIDLVVGRDFGSDLDPYREKLLEALPKNRETQFPLRPLSRAEVLFGRGTFISFADYGAALDLCGDALPCS